MLHMQLTAFVNARRRIKKTMVKLSGATPPESTPSSCSQKQEIDEHERAIAGGEHTRSEDLDFNPDMSAIG